MLLWNKGGERDAEPPFCYGDSGDTNAGRIVSKETPPFRLAGAVDGSQPPAAQSFLNAARTDRAAIAGQERDVAQDVPDLSSVARPIARSRSQSVYLLARSGAERLAALVALVLLLPVLLTTYALIRATSEGPGLFWSVRVGRGFRPFLMPKFRTMYHGTDLVQREKMACPVSTVTPIGRWLRRWSIDELPQLWSILRGDMSFIGPRPLIPQDEAQVERERMGLCHDIRPGLTGLAQINGRNHVDARTKARYDVFYGRRVDLGLDLLVLRRTFRIVVHGIGVW